MKLNVPHSPFLEASFQLSGAKTAYFPRDQDCLTTKSSSRLQDGVIEGFKAELKNEGVQGEAQYACLVCGQWVWENASDMSWSLWSKRPSKLHNEMKLWSSYKLTDSRIKLYLNLSEFPPPAFMSLSWVSIHPILYDSATVRQAALSTVSSSDCCLVTQSCCSHGRSSVRCEWMFAILELFHQVRKKYHILPDDGAEETILLLSMSPKGLQPWTLTELVYINNIKPPRTASLLLKLTSGDLVPSHSYRPYKYIHQHGLFPENLRKMLKETPSLDTSIYAHPYIYTLSAHPIQLSLQFLVITFRAIKELLLPQTVIAEVHRSGLITCPSLQARDKKRTRCFWSSSFYTVDLSLCLWTHLKGVTFLILKGAI